MIHGVRKGGWSLCGDYLFLISMLNSCPNRPRNGLCGCSHDRGSLLGHVSLVVHVSRSFARVFWMDTRIQSYMRLPESFRFGVSSEPFVLLVSLSLPVLFPSKLPEFFFCANELYSTVI